MVSEYTYRPVPFFVITFLLTWIPGFIAAYLSYQKGMEGFQLPFMLAGLLAPFMAAMIMIYGSKNKSVIKDFWDKLSLFRIRPWYLIVIITLMPVVVFLATATSCYLVNRQISFLL